ncbi:MAG: tyrosine-type recombinase/integrase [Planctomycetes bacterium]|nr:tyrosine-type recombinase/integrase [Planctomycetota bacterium]
MPRPPKPPRVMKWRGKDYLFYYDHGSGKTVRECLDGVAKDKQRERVQARTVDFREGQANAARGYVVKTAFDTLLADAIQTYREDIDERIKARRNNPNARVGLAESSAYELHITIDRFLAWLEANGHKRIRTGTLSPHEIRGFFQSLASMPGKLGEKIVKRSAATLNKARRNLMTMLRWLNQSRPSLFPDFEPLEHACKLQRVDPPEPCAFTPNELKRFHAALVEREQPGYVRVVRDKKRSNWAQPATATAATPQSLLFVLLALTGMRLGEALKLKWSDVDLKRGRITIRAGKTGKRRVLPLTGAPESDVAPGMLEELRRLKLRAGTNTYILPCGKPTTEQPEPSPTYVRRAWAEVGKAIGLREIKPQALRQNFVGYCASMGVPESVAALWCGHSPAIATRYYRSQVLERNEGDNIEVAMGLDAVFSDDSGQAVAM